MTVFIYDTKRIVNLTLRETGGVNNWNLPMNVNDFNLFKNVFNTIEFVVRNTDRKPVNMIGRTAHITLYDQRHNKILWETDLIPVDDAKGKVKMVMKPDVAENWNLDSYSYHITVTNTDGATHMLYVDANESQRGFFKLKQGPVFDPKPSYEEVWEDFAMINEGAHQRYSYRYSSAFPGSVTQNNSAALHTMLVELDNFSGYYVIQGSVELGTPTEQNWFDIEIDGKTKFEYLRANGKYVHNFEANLSWVRLWIFNKSDQLEPFLPEEEGKIKRVQFRN